VIVIDLENFRENDLLQLVLETPIRINIEDLREIYKRIPDKHKSLSPEGWTVAERFLQVKSAKSHDDNRS